MWLLRLSLFRGGELGYSGELVSSGESLYSSMEIFLLAQSGIISIGIGDSFAAIIGILCGKKKTKGEVVSVSPKTWIGTVAFFIAYASFYILNYLLYIHYHGLSATSSIIYVLLLCSLILAIMEKNHDTNG